VGCKDAYVIPVVLLRRHLVDSNSLCCGEYAGIIVLECAHVLCHIAYSAQLPSLVSEMTPMDVSNSISGMHYKIPFHDFLAMYQLSSPAHGASRRQINFDFQTYKAPNSPRHPSQMLT
jgi:hypothetical protein